jgi:hypothetical protein
MSEEERELFDAVRRHLDQTVIAMSRINESLRGLTMIMERLALPERSAWFGCQRGPSCTLPFNDPIHTEGHAPDYHRFSV